MAKEKFTLGLRKNTGLKFNDPPEIGPEPNLCDPQTMALAFESIKWAFEKIDQTGEPKKTKL